MVRGAGVSASDSSRSVYNLSAASLRNFRAAMGKGLAGTGLCEIAWAGPSTAQGYPNLIKTQSPPAFLLARMIARGLPVAPGWVWVTNNFSAPNNVDSRVTMSGWTNPFSGIGFKTPTSRGNVNGQTITFTFDTPGTVVEWFVTGIFGTYTYTIDGGTAVPVAAGGSSTVAPTIKQVTGLADTTHTLVITCTSATSVYVAMARVRKTAGILLTNAGFGASRSWEWDQTLEVNHFFGLQEALRYGGAPNLVIFDACTWLNDCIQDSWTPAQTQASLTRIVGQLKAAGSDVLLIASAAPSASIAFSTYPIITDVQYQQFRQVLYAVSDATDVGLVDVPDRHGDWTVANPNGLMNDALHLTPAGNAAVARAVDSVIAA